MEKPISPESKRYGNLGWGSLKNLAKAHGNEGLEWAGDAQRNETSQGCPKEQNGPRELEGDKMGQGSPKQYEYKPNDSTGLLELSRRKAYSRPKRGSASTSKILTCQEQRGGMVGVSIDPQRG